MNTKFVFGFLSGFFLFMTLFSSLDNFIWKWFLGFSALFFGLWILKNKLLRLDYGILIVFSALCFLAILFSPPTGNIWKVFLYLGIVLGVWWGVKRLF